MYSSTVLPCWRHFKRSTEAFKFSFLSLPVLYFKRLNSRSSLLMQSTCTSRQLRRYKLEQLHLRWSRLILNPLQNRLHFLCYSSSYFSRCKWKWTYWAFRWDAPLTCRYGFPMLIKIGVCLPSSLFRWGDTGDGPIFGASVSERETEIFTWGVVCIHQWAQEKEGDQQ